MTFSDFIESAMAEVGTRVETAQGENEDLRGLYESLDAARAALASGAWLDPDVTKVEFLDADEQVIETWTRTASE